MGLDVLLVHRLLLGVGQEHHHQIGLGRGPVDRGHPETRTLGLRLRRRPLAQADAHVDARLLEVERVGVTLRPVADDRDLAPGDERGVGVLLVVDHSHGVIRPFR